MSANRLARGQVKRRPVLSSWSQRARLLPHRHGVCRAGEQFRILFLDKRNELIADEVQQTGTVDHTPVLREVVKRALEFLRRRSSWCTTILPAIRRRRAPTSR